MPGLFSRLLAFLRKGLFPTRGGEREFYDRIERGDVKYIMEVGVPSIQPPETPGPRPWRVPYIAEGVGEASLLLLDPEALMYILMATEVTRDLLRSRGDGSKVLRDIAAFTRERPGYYYFDSVPEFGSEIRVLAGHGLVTGLYVSYGGKSYTGVEAYSVLETLHWDDIAFTVSRVKPRLLEWRDEILSVYIRGLDNQHKYLVNTLNSLYHATIAGESGSVASSILKRLVDYTKFHFRSEEILMEKYDYPQDRYMRHVKEHRAFVDATVKFREKYERGEATLTVDVFKFLATWIKNHVAGTDRDYGRYFLEIGIANYIPEHLKRQGVPKSQ